MITHKHGSYHFRRVVPEPIRKAVGQREIWVSLATCKKREARLKAGLIYSQTEKLFAFMSEGRQLPDKFNLKKYLLEMVQKHPSDFDNTYDKQTSQIEIQQNHLIDAPESVVNHFINNVNNRNSNLLNHIQKLGNELEQSKQDKNPDKEILLLHALQDAISVAKNLSSQRQADNEIKQEVNNNFTVGFADISERYINARRTEIGIETIQQIETAVKLFTKFMQSFGPKLIDKRKRLAEYTRKDAREFIDLIRQLPKTYGKSAKDRQRPLEDIIENAEKKDPEYITISRDVVERHIDNIKKIWEYAQSSGELGKGEQYDIWSNHLITPLREKLTDKRPFTDDELAKLQQTKWNSRIHPNTMRQIIAIGSFSGMRLEEICRLRPIDIEKVNGIMCFHIRKHYDENGKLLWDPKTEAGERIIPLHSYLKSDIIGLLDRAKNCQKAKKNIIFYDLPYDELRNKYGAGFSKRFSAFKQSAGLSEQTTFHSFRHLVRTKLGHRANGELYPKEWIQQIMGHEQTGMDQIYDHGTIVHNLKIVIDSLHYDNWEPHKIIRR